MRDQKNGEVRRRFCSFSLLLLNENSLCVNLCFLCSAGLYGKVHTAMQLFAFLDLSKMRLYECSCCSTFEGMKKWKMNSREFFLSGWTNSKEQAAG